MFTIPMRRIVRKVELEKRLLGKELNEIRKRLLELSFDDQVTVIALQQGVGKTHMFIEYARKYWKKEKIVFASPRHDHLREIMEKLPNNSARHWWGFGKRDNFGVYRGCPKLNKNIPILNELKKEENKNLLKPKFVCDILNCNKVACSYYQTHTKSDKVELMPMEYLGTGWMLQQHPKIVFIDESINKINEYRYNSELISGCIAISQDYDYSQLSDNLASLIPKPQYSFLQSSLLNNIEEDRDALISELIRTEEFNDAIKLNSLNSVLNYLRYAPSYDSDYYYKPKIYDAFDLAYEHNIKVVFLNASFNEDLFIYFLKTYPSNDLRDITVPVYTSDIINPESILIRVYPNNMFWKGAFEKKKFDSTFRKIYEVISRIEKYIPREKIGVITYKNIGNENETLDGMFRDKGYDALHFGAESGLNILESKYILFVIGTPFFSTEDVIGTWEEIYDEKTDLEAEDIGSPKGEEYFSVDKTFGLVKVKQNTYERYDVFKGIPRWKKEILGMTIKSIEDILKGEGITEGASVWVKAILEDFKDKEEKEYDFRLIKQKCLYQTIDSIHRCRPLTHDRIVIALGNTPKNIGIRYLEVNNPDELEDIIKNHKVVDNNRTREFIEYILDNKDYMKDKSIAKALHLWNENRNLDTSFVKEIKRVIDNVNKRIK